MMLLRETLKIRAFGLLKIPMILFLSPSVLEATDKKIVIKIPLTLRSRNHLKSMYFGALCVGADLAGGVMAMNAIQRNGDKVNLVFKDLKADFLKRAEADVHFVCDQGEAINDLVLRALKSGERENLPVHVTALTPQKTGNEPVAKFTLTLSLKRKGA